MTDQAREMREMRIRDRDRGSGDDAVLRTCLDGLGACSARSAHLLLARRVAGVRPAIKFDYLPDQAYAPHFASAPYFG